jgi:hypothetical protein
MFMGGFLEACTYVVSCENAVHELETADENEEGHEGV